MDKKINLPNKLTILRMFLVPVFVILMIAGEMLEMNIMYYIACAVFVFASLTDFLDGYLSRKNNQVTKFGKIMDPLADKILVAAGFIMLTGEGKIPAIITVIIILRDFLVNAVRMFGSDKGVVIAAEWPGKIKTASQLIGVSLCIVDKYSFGECLVNSSVMSSLDFFVNIAVTVTITIAVIATIWSAIDYIRKFGKYINVNE